MSINFTAEHAKELRFHLEDAAIKCSERGLYQSAKWCVSLMVRLSTTFTERWIGLPNSSRLSSRSNQIR